MSSKKSTLCKTPTKRKASVLPEPLNMEEVKKPAKKARLEVSQEDKNKNKKVLSFHEEEEEEEENAPHSPSYAPSSPKYSPSSPRFLSKPLADKEWLDRRIENLNDQEYSIWVYLRSVARQVDNHEKDNLDASELHFLEEEQDKLTRNLVTMRAKMAFFKAQLCFHNLGKADNEDVRILFENLETEIADHEPTHKEVSDIFSLLNK